MGASPSDPDESGFLTPRERRILADIEHEFRRIRCPPGCSADRRRAPTPFVVALDRIVPRLSSSRWSSSFRSSGGAASPRSPQRSSCSSSSHAPVAGAASGRRCRGDGHPATVDALRPALPPTTITSAPCHSVNPKPRDQRSLDRHRRSSGSCPRPRRCRHPWWPIEPSGTGVVAVAALKVVGGQACSGRWAGVVASVAGRRAIMFGGRQRGGAAGHRAALRVHLRQGRVGTVARGGQLDGAITGADGALRPRAGGVQRRIERYNRRRG